MRCDNLYVLRAAHNVPILTRAAIQEAAMEMGTQTRKSRLGSVRRFRRAREGFSLVELMVAIGVCTILTAIAIPSYLSYIQRTKVTTAVMDIV